MGRPDASVTSEGVRLSAFASRLGTDTSRAQFSNKAAVLVFIAPQDGLYSISGSAEMTISSGAGPGRMMILKHDQQARRIRKLADEILTPEVTLKLVDFRVKLGATDEIMIFPWNDKDKDGSELMLRNLAVARLGSP